MRLPGHDAKIAAGLSGMRITTLVCLALALGVGSSADAKDRRVATIFACTLSNGKSVRITAEGDRLTYRYGRGVRTELMIAGTPATGNVLFGQGLFASMETQLRFVRGAYSYIVYSMDANRRKGSSAVSGLVVMRGTQSVSDLSCTRWARFVDGSDLMLRFPADDDRFSAM